MGNNDTLPEAVSNLAAALESTLNLVRCEDVAALRKLSAQDPPAKVGFVVNRSLRIGNHYDIQPAITIYDPSLGTVAFVEHINRAEDGKSSAWNAIERATAVRQILIDEATREQRARNLDPARRDKPPIRVLPLQVEVVLLVSGGAQASGPDAVRTCLTDVARETGYLRLVGVSVLDLAQHPTLDGDVLRRAFAWLLQGTFEWLRRFGADGSADAWRKKDAPVTLSLNEYRLAGERHFSCPGNVWLSLVHGHNGSGKSSLAEAVELLLTKRIQRLDDAGEKNYFRIVRHRPYGANDTRHIGLGPCSVTLRANNAEITKVVIESGQSPNRVGREPSAVLQTNSFRIDQVFMDKLIRSQAPSRAALFLSAFSPGDAPVLVQLQELKSNVQSGWKHLPEHVRKKAETEAASARSTANVTSAASTALSADEMAAFVIRELGPLYPETEPTAGQPSAGMLSPAALEGLLPIGRSELLRLAQIHPPIRDSLNALLAVTDPTALSDAFAQFESAVNVVRSSLPSYIADLATSLRVFQEFRMWSVGNRGPSGDFETNLRRWLELQALFDLTKRYADIVNAVSGALAHNWTPNPLDQLLASAGKPPASDVALTKRRDQLADELSKAKRRVESSSESDSEVPTPAPSTPTRRWLPPTEIDALNRVDQFLTTTRGRDPLGVRFNRALAGHEEDLAEGSIGRAGGLDHAIEEMVEMKFACEALQQAGAAATPSGADLNQLTRNLVKTARDLQKVSKELPENFFYRLAHGNPHEQDALAAAFNELLALMTPARWAYRDIRLRADLPDGSPQLGLQTIEGAPADLLFNTAELNASALVLFLLLAPRLKNDMRLLVLDDPLQNMDELTVITLGRALAKLRIFYPKDWSVLAFFHGEENIARIRDETPCHLYQLPWLQSATAGEKPIEAVSGDDECSWQTLKKEVIADPPARAQNRAATAHSTTATAAQS